MIPTTVNSNGDRFRVLIDNGQLYRVAPVDEIIILHLGALVSGDEEIWIELSTKGVSTDLQLISLWQRTETGQIKKGINLRLLLPNENTFYKTTIISSAYSFPFLVVKPDWKVGLSALESIADVILYAKVVHTASELY